MTDQAIRDALKKLWKKSGSLKSHCGGKGLVVGCPVCGKRWPL